MKEGREEGRKRRKEESEGRKEVKEGRKVKEGEGRREDK